jgi:broad specificity phosphatase PhoE
MTRLYLIRHAKPAATWSEAADPGLDTTGLAQAQAAAARMAVRLPHGAPLYTSPLQRCRQTAAPLEASWQRAAEILPAVAEIPAPPDVHERHLWLQQAMAGTWLQLEQRAQPGWPDYQQWRGAMLRRLRDLSEDSVIFTHYIAINVVVGAALDDERVVCFRPDHASITIVEIEAASLRLIELGQQAETLVLARS